MTNHQSTAPSLDIQPIPVGLPIPNRKIIRGWIEPFAEKETAKAILLLAIDILIWLTLIAGTVFIENLLVKIILGNLGTKDETINHGDRVAQLVLVPVTQALFESEEKLSETLRGAGGFGSTGRN